MASYQIEGKARFCPNCLLRELPPEERLDAYRGKDGRISCMSCGLVSNPLPDNEQPVLGTPRYLRELIAELISSRDPNEVRFRLLASTVGQGQGAVAQGLSLEDVRTHLPLVRGKDEHLDLYLTGSDIRVAEECKSDFGRAYVRLEEDERICALGGRPDSVMPDALHEAAQFLSAAGFRVIANAWQRLNHNSLILVRGMAMGKRHDVPIGIHAHLSWVSK